MRKLITKTNGTKRSTKAKRLVGKLLSVVVTHGTRVISMVRFISIRLAGMALPAYAPAMGCHRAAALSGRHQATGLVGARRSWRRAGPGSARSGHEA